MYLSPPDVTELEAEFVLDAVRSGWVAPLGPYVDRFEAEVAQRVGAEHAVALSSGTAALQLGLQAVGVGPGDTIIVPTLTFAASAFSVVHAGATPVFVDVEPDSWNLDPQLLGSVLAELDAQGQLPAAVMSVDLFGRSCDYDAILAVTSRFGVPLVEDAAEGLGGEHVSAEGSTRALGNMGRVGAFSFNGNKIMTTSGGGMLVTDDAEIARRAKHWSTQSREPLPWYEHNEIGYNYRMSNVLAALGCAQLSRLDSMIAARHAVRDAYAEQLNAVPGVSIMEDPGWSRTNDWLTVAVFDTDSLSGEASERVRKALMEEGIESRPVWKPMHQQPVFVDARSYLTGVADRAFAQGLVLPSGSAMTEDDVCRVVDVVKRELG